MGLHVKSQTDYDALGGVYAGLAKFDEPGVACGEAAAIIVSPRTSLSVQIEVIQPDQSRALSRHSRKVRVVFEASESDGSPSIADLGRRIQ